MSEARLVRCPKCDKVLPEPSGCPVYQCGGCGVVLRAKKKLSEENLVNSGASDLYKEPLVKEGTTNMDSRSPLRSMVGNGDGNKSPFRENGLTEFHGGLPKSPMRERFLDDLGKTPMVSREASRSPMRGRDGSSEFDQDGIDSPARSSNASRSPLRGRGRTPVSMRTKDVSRPHTREGTSSSDLDGVGRSMNGDVPKSPLRRGLGSEKEEGVRKITPKASFDAWLTGDKHEELSGGGRRSIWRDRAVDRPDQISEGVKPVLSDDNGFTSEGSFDDPFHGARRSIGGVSRDERFKNASVRGNARPNVVNGPSDYHPDPIYDYGDPTHQLSGLDDADMSSPGVFSERDGWSEGESLRIRRRQMQQFPSDRNEHRPSHFNREPFLAHNGEDIYYANHPRYNQHPPKHTVPKHFQDRRDSHVNDTHAHHPACDCSVCSYSNDWKGRDRRGNHNMDGERYGPRGYDPRMANSGPRGQTSHPVHQPTRPEVNKRKCRPISGGAPFVICNNCFQLLILPGNSIAKHKNKQLKCGGCSTVISFDLQNKSDDPLSPEKKPEPVLVADSSSNVTNALRPRHHRGTPAATSTNIGSYDFEAARASFQSIDSETSSRPIKGRTFLNPTSADNTSGFTPSPSRFSVEEPRSCDTTSVQSNRLNSSETPMMIRPPPGSPLLDHLEYSSQFQGPQAPEKLIIDKDDSPEGPLDITDAIETEVPINDMPTTGLSQDSEDIPREIPVTGNDKAVESRIDIILKDMKSRSAHGSPLRAEVYVNGQAISHRSIKKAQKFAGNIQPGEYWYDAKAGFWGVMGRRCLGIIPPSIQEFSSPMEENCSKGDSAVYVNGRELPKEDLDLLSGRGLPITRDKRYVVDISGKVVDEDTLDFVVNLGRLAPSVERNKCGFGMQVPEKLN